MEINNSNKILNFEDYGNEIISCLEKIDLTKIKDLSQKILNAIKKSKKIIFMGNGGSAANAIHIVGDYMKTFSFLGYNPRISTPFDNICFLTAVSNDSDFNESFYLYLRSVIEQESLIIMLSGSGNSINLIKCFNDNLIRDTKGSECWSLTGFKGGKLSKLSDKWIHLPTMDMEAAEDMQMIIFHYIKKVVFKELSENKSKLEDANNERYFKRTVLNEIS